MSAFIPPDWRIASAYPTEPNNWQLEQWIWAFLRRNPEYQRDYENFSKFPELVKRNSRNSLADAFDPAKFRYCKYPTHGDETIGEYFSRTDDETPYFCSLEDYLIDEKWEILYLTDPAKDEGYDCIPHHIDLPKEISDFEHHLTEGKGIIATERG
ncbi:transcriptional regulator domain-containing protein [Nitrosomonas sp. Is37]|uniref:transcriptional regulator domain-containing protein n=1 Tax=Nitrosomonas sp. Is37 TaxID=3080535 RepID=UPI00294AD32C|nr:DUF6499 domain-containing protein [Nitrosomonas sp. Is37]MDV6345646.1 DUF6499 domain-containing protein [Nitrosomonas sp. Is37]